MNVIDALRHHSRMRPFDMAVVHPSGAANYHQLAQAVTAVAARMRAEGLQPGQRAAIYAADPFLHLLLVLAGVAAGVVTISGHPNYDPIPEAARLDAYLCDRDPGFRPAGRVILVGPAWVGESLPEGQAILPPTGAFQDPAETSRMMVSSGTTGLPKVVGWTVGAVERSILQGVTLEPVSQGPNLSMMALSTVGGIGTAQLSLWHGATLVLATQPLLVLRFINLYKVASLRASPQQLQALVNLVKAHPARFPSLQRIEIGGASIPPSLLVAARATLCPHVVGIYGSTETGLVAQVPGAVLHQLPDAAGYVVPGVEVRIVDDEGRDAGLEREGHVQLRSTTQCSGYVGDEAATRAAFRDGWFVPGDLGIMRADGLLRVTGRADEVINAGGVKLSPMLVDNFLLAQPGVVEAAAFARRRAGQPDEVWAAVVCTPDADEPALLAAARAKLSSRAPTRLLRVAEIPRNAMGKPLRDQLSKQLGG